MKTDTKTPKIIWWKIPFAFYWENVIWVELTCPCCFMLAPFIKFGKEAKI